MSAEVTNVFIYHLDSTDKRKHAVAERIVRDGLATGNACISFQVVQECLNTALRKAEVALDTDAARSYLDTVLTPLLQVPASLALYHRALDVRHGCVDSTRSCSSWQTSNAGSAPGGTRQGRFLGRRGAERMGRRAQRASTTDSRALFERSEPKVSGVSSTARPVREHRSAVGVPADRPSMSPCRVSPAVPVLTPKGINLQTAAAAATASRTGTPPARVCAGVEAFTASLPRRFAARGRAAGNCSFVVRCGALQQAALRQMAINLGAPPC